MMEPGIRQRSKMSRISKSRQNEKKENKDEDLDRTLKRKGRLSLSGMLCAACVLFILIICSLLTLFGMILYKELQPPPMYYPESSEFILEPVTIYSFNNHSNVFSEPIKNQRIIVNDGIIEKIESSFNEMDEKYVGYKLYTLPNIQEWFIFPSFTDAKATLIPSNSFYLSDYFGMIYLYHGVTSLFGDVLDSRMRASYLSLNPCLSLVNEVPMKQTKGYYIISKLDDIKKSIILAKEEGYSCLSISDEAFPKSLLNEIVNESELEGIPIIFDAKLTLVKEFNGKSNVVFSSSFSSSNNFDYCLFPQRFSVTGAFQFIPESFINFLWNKNTWHSCLDKRPENLKTKDDINNVDSFNIGTNSLYPFTVPGISLYNELEYLVNLDITLEHAFNMASGILFGDSHGFGKIEENNSANFLLHIVNPLKSDSVPIPRAVISKGNIFWTSKLSKIFDDYKAYYDRPLIKTLWKYI